MLSPVRTVEPAETPVDLDWIKAQLRVDHTDDDEVLEQLIQAATDHLDGWSGILGRALVTQTWRIDLSSLPPCGYVRLPLLPVQSVTFTYWDASNVTQTFDATNYELFNDARGSILTLASGASWPTIYRRRDAASLTFVAGYGEAENVPSPIKSAIKLHVEMHYDTDVDQDVWQKRFDSLIFPLRVMRV